MHRLLSIGRVSGGGLNDNVDTRAGHYVFEFDLEAAATEVIGDEEWRDVVLDD